MSSSGDEEIEAKRNILVTLMQVSRFYPSLVSVDPHYAVDLYISDAGSRYHAQKAGCHEVLVRNDNCVTQTIAYLSAQLGGMPAQA